MGSDRQYTPYKIIECGGSGEIEEKKSRFIAHVAAAGTEEEALAFIEEKRKRFWDARHNCYAYVLGQDAQTMRFSDDGEPSGTAGRPIMDVITAAGIRDAVIVVTRYFGGTLLGTGGLVRAYTKAAQAGIAASVVRTMCCGYEVNVLTDYNGVGKVQYLLGSRGIPVEGADYAAQATIRFRVPWEEKDTVVDKITEATAGRARITVSGPLFYKRE